MLADAFNHMLDRLADAFAGQRAFVADASHELRTPLTVIQGQLEVLAAQDQPSVEEIRRVEELVQSEVSRITRLVDDLLLLASSEQTAFLRVESIPLRAVRDGAVGRIHACSSRSAASNSARCRREHSTADPDRLAQALRNLVRNAIEHTEPGEGRVHAACRAGRAGPCPLRRPGRRAGDPAEDQRELVFDRFHRTDARPRPRLRRDRAGTGDRARHRRGPWRHGVVRRRARQAAPASSSSCQASGPRHRRSGVCRPRPAASPPPEQTLPMPRACPWAVADRRGARAPGATQEPAGADWA